MQEQTDKPWKAKKSEVLQFWQNLKSDLPIHMRPVSEEHRGTRFRKDGIRITGTPTFINSIICRLKDLLPYEGQEHRLDVEYRQVENKTDEPTNDANFVFYAHLVKNDSQAPKVTFPKI